mgnify:CR=1 FL=1
MAVIQKQFAMAAGDVIENALSGSAFEFLRRPSVISIGVTASATGTFATIQSGPDVILEESPPMVQNTFARIPDEMAYNFAGVTGDRLVVRLDRKSTRLNSSH